MSFLVRAEAIARDILPPLVVRTTSRALKELRRIITREPKIAPGEFDPATLPQLLRKENPVILDIGCNNGGHTLLFLSLFKNARVFSFEPDPRAQARFKKEVTDSRAKLFEMAISATDGTAEFYVSDGLPPAEWKAALPAGWDLSGSIKRPKKHLKVHPWCTFKERITVSTKKLDTWRREEGIDQIDLIWADVQGAEADLIKGGKTALQHTRYFYTEYSNYELYEGQPRLHSLMKLLPDFAIVARYSNDVLFENKQYK